MFFKRSKPAEAFGWAHPLDAAQGGELAAIVDRECARRALRWNRKNGEVSFDAGVIRLHNVAQNCARSERPLWPKLVASHIENGLRAASVRELDGLSLDKARPLLRTRIYGAGYEQLVPGLAHREIGQKVYACLVLDLPTAVAPVPKEVVAEWKADVDELLEEATARTRAKEPRLQRRDRELEAGVRITALASDSVYTTTALFWIDEYLGEIPDAGLLIGIPHRHMLLVHPIVPRSDAVPTVLSTLVPMTAGIFSEGPGAISPHVHWWRGEGPLEPVTGMGPREIERLTSSGRRGAR